MSDVLLIHLCSTLPDELAALLRDQVYYLEQGDFRAILELPLAKILFSHSEDDATKGVNISEYPVWSDFIFRRLGILLSKREVDRDYEEKSNPVYRQYFFLIVAVASLYAFLQSNVTGPTLSFSSAKLLFPSDVASNEEALATARQRLILSLGVDGEAAYRLIPNVELFCLADTIITCPPITKNILAARWVKLRIDFLHQRLLSEIAPSLQSSIYGDLEIVEDAIKADKTAEFIPDLTVSFLLERATIHTHHGLEKKARADLYAAAQRRGFEFALTGLLGKRTKYQTNDTSQLVVLAQSSTTLKNGIATTTDIKDHTLGETTRNAPANQSMARPKLPKNLDLNDDTLLESISFTKGNQDTSTDVKDESSLPPSLTSLDPENQPILDPLDSAILLSLASSITNTSPADGLTREETLPYATRVLEGGSSNWQIYTQALLVRSRVEGYKSRTVERGLLQLQALVDQVIAATSGTSRAATQSENTVTSFLPKVKKEEDAPVSERLRYIFQLCTPTRWELEAELAARWVNIGGLRSALEIYERLEMWPEAALCWAATEQDEKARRIVRKLLFHSSSSRDEDVNPEEKWNGSARDPPPADAPRLYCILGDIDHDPEMYEKAWNISNSRYARAQRSLGRYYFAQKDYAKAANAYSKSLKVNQVNHASWFAYGCALLELSQFERAVEAFSRIVQLDDTDGEAWSNLAVALLRLDRKSAQDEQPNATTDKVDGDDGFQMSSNGRQQNSQQHTQDALEALKRAAHLKYENYRIWDNLLTVAASLRPPSYSDIINAQKRIIELRGKSDGEKCIDADVIDLLVRHIITLDTEGEGYNPATPGLPRMVVELVDKNVVPLVTASKRLWQIVGRLSLWRGKPTSALEANEKAWRAVISQPGWEYGTEKEWDAVVDATVELVDVYQSLGGRERTEGMGAGTGELVAKDWKFKARSAVRGIMGRGKGSWEGTAGWDRLKESLDDLRGSA